jgi:hypothetical protein
MQESHPELASYNLSTNIEQTLQNPDINSIKNGNVIWNIKTTIYFDKEADFFEVLFENTESYFKETDNDSIMEKVSKVNRIIGFNIINVSKITLKRPVQLELTK